MTPPKGVRMVLAIVLTVAVFGGEAMLAAATGRWVVFVMAVTVTIGVWVALWYSLHRLTVLRDVYAAGYRHGRHDSTTALFEQGVWLSHAAEKRSQDLLGDEEEEEKG